MEDLKPAVLTSGQKGPGARGVQRGKTCQELADGEDDEQEV
jgi:hypothetical protein